MYKVVIISNIDTGVNTELLLTSPDKSGQCGAIALCCQVGEGVSCFNVFVSAVHLCYILAVIL